MDILKWLRNPHTHEVAEMASTHQSDHEEMVLQALMLHFTNFNFDKAKDQAEKERDMSRGVGSSMWQSLLTCIAQLAIAEKLYMNLSFLTSKGFLRKESSVRANFESLSIEFGELEKRNFETSNIRGSNARCSNAKTSNGNNAGNETANPGSPGSPGSLGNPGNLGNPGSPVSDGLLEHICSHLVLFTKARLQMIAFYERMVGSSMDRLMNFDELLAHVTDISMNNSRNFHHPLLTPLKTSFTYECDILMHLLRSQIEMQFWRFFPSLLHLHDAHTKLNTWHAVVQSKETKKYGFGSNFLKSSPLPPLYQWLWQAKAAFVSKYSLYFHETLAAQSSPADMKGLISRQGQACDYVSKIQSFQRRSDAASVCLVFEAAGVEDYQGAGYHHPQESLSPPKGLDSYPAIFSYPPTKPLDRWPSIVMRVSDRSNEFTLMDRVVHFFDQQIGSTYFLCRVEPRITIVVIFDTKKSEKDNYIKDFVYDLAMQLRGNKVFQNLKPK